VRPLVLLSAPLLAGCLIQNPGFDADETTTHTSTSRGSSTGPGITTGDPDTTDTTDATDTTLGGSGDGSTSTTDTGTTGCTAEPLFPDNDNDGFGAGAAVLACPGEPGMVAADGDCNDADNAVNPGATELCNQRDDDCDGLLDEFSASNADCTNCNLAEFGGHSYWFCRATASWDGARSVCQVFGAVDLAIVDDLAENDFLFAGNALPDLPLWVGGRDSDPNTQAVYTWYDGSPLTFNNFALADLDNGCIAMPNGDAGKWRDRDCNFDYSYVCESKD
jgi:hypothetical protein